MATLPPEPALPRAPRGAPARARVAAALLLGPALGCGAEAPSPDAAEGPPNLVLIVADDLGYGDLGSYGHPAIRTPHLDRLAAEGQRWTHFYATAPICTPSRAALLTGRLAVRSGMTGARGVIWPDSAGGLPPGEITIAEGLKGRGYATAYVGKWHLGHLPPYQPTRNGFDYYFGLPYSNDMDRVERQGRTVYDVPLLRGSQVVERPARQDTLTQRFTEEAVDFIRRHRRGPFFLYLAHTAPHVPLFPGAAFRGRSAAGAYGDVVEELDGSVGQVVEVLRELGLEHRTLLVFTSDNGPLLSGESHGSAGPLSGGKWSILEGGVRVPALFWWPGTIPEGSVVSELGSTLDLLPTVFRLAEVALPSDRILDGYDLGPVLRGSGPSPRREMFFYQGEALWAARLGSYKAHFLRLGEALGPGRFQVERDDPPRLYDLERDPGERSDVAAAHPDVIAEIIEMVTVHRETVQPVENQLTKVIGGPPAAE